MNLAQASEPPLVPQPSEGSFDLQTAFRVRSVVYGNPGHPDQAPYINVWIDVVSDAPKYLKDCQEEKERILREAAKGVSDPTGQPTTDPARVQLVFPSTRPDWNPYIDQATLLPDDDPQQPLHDCLELLDNITCLRPDLTDVQWPEPDATLYTNGSSFVAEGVRYAGAAVVARGTVIWAQALRHGTSAQRAELIAVTQALPRGKEKTVNNYTDSSPYRHYTRQGERFNT
ncbi:uncharacterized protein LOC120621159 [Pteropus medius]|uniref:uncharacterized protein LOC120621159 n=1 Tax=Pteropus vampyrus TaxID=132908 RepID=UPI00196A64E7|nr:uncharacterized protein LOC120621159 [Pteropus giganteus]